MELCYDDALLIVQLEVKIVVVIEYVVRLALKHGSSLGLGSSVSLIFEMRSKYPLNFDDLKKESKSTTPNSSHTF